MTNEKAICILMNSNEYHHAKGDWPQSSLSVEAFNMAIEALKTHDQLCENLAWYINERQRLLKEIARACAEWLPDDELSFDPARPWFKCSHCYERTGIRTKYCPDCGYKMRCQEDG